MLLAEATLGDTLVTLKNTYSISKELSVELSGLIVENAENV
jgi:hypothetical protein